MGWEGERGEEEGMGVGGMEEEKEMGEEMEEGKEEREE